MPHGGVPAGYASSMGHAAADIRAFFATTHLSRLRQKGVRDSTIAEYRCVLRSLPDDVTLDSVTEWLSHLDRSAATRNRYRRYLLAVLRHMVRRGAAELPWLDDIPPAAEMRRVPRAWTVDEFSSLLDATEVLRERYCGIPARSWWRSFLLALWYTGARVETVAAATRNNLSLRDGWLLLVSTKDRAEIVYDLPRDCVDAIRQMGIVRHPAVWPWPWRDGKRTRLRRIRRLIEHAGLPQVARPFHAIRRSVASYVAASDGVAAACAALDHSRPGITSRYYIDPRIARRRVDLASAIPQPKMVG